jgi:hypothetical protein
MWYQDRYSITHRLGTMVAALALLGIGSTVPAVQGAEGIARPGPDALPILAAADGMDRRQGRREDQRDDRGDRRDTRQTCQDDEGVVGKDKRDCKQDGRQERREDDND